MYRSPTYNGPSSGPLLTTRAERIESNRSAPYGSVFKTRYSREPQIGPTYHHLPHLPNPSHVGAYDAYDTYGGTYDSPRTPRRRTRIYEGLGRRPGRKYSPPGSDDGKNEAEADPDSDVDYMGSDNESCTYAFQLARPRSPPSTVISTEDDRSSTVLEAKPTTPAVVRQKTVSHVYESQYTGLGIPDDLHSARLTIVHGAPVATAAQPLFRWM